jgi:hypothetical protein
MKHTVEQLRFPKTTVKTVAKFRQVAGQVFGAKAMMGATNIAFDVCDQSMHPGQDFRGLFARTGNKPFKAVGRAIKEAPKLQKNFWEHSGFYYPADSGWAYLFRGGNGHVRRLDPGQFPKQLMNPN